MLEKLRYASGVRVQKSECDSVDCLEAVRGGDAEDLGSFDFIGCGRVKVQMGEG